MSLSGRDPGISTAKEYPSTGATTLVGCGPTTHNQVMPLAYPPARRDTQVDDFHGEKVADPYRWLEDPKTPDTVAWVAQQGRLTESWLAGVLTRSQIGERVRELWDHPRFGVPFERGGRWFQYRNGGLDPQSALYVVEHPGGAAEMLVDPTELTPDGTTALVDAVPSPDGRLLAYATSGGGSDWMTWRVLDVVTKTDLPDVVEWSKFSTAAWLPDATGFFYVAPRRPQLGSELEAETRGLRVLLHRLGHESDEVVWSAEDRPEWLPHAAVTDDGRYLVVSITRGTRPESRVEIFDLDAQHRMVAVVGPDFAAEMSLAGNDGGRFYFVTDEDAGRKRLVCVELEEPASRRVLVPEGADVLEGARRCGDGIVCWYLRDAQLALRVHDLDGRLLRDVDVPAWSSIVRSEDGSVSGRPGLDLVHFATTSFTDSGTVWQHGLSSGTTRVLHPPTASFDAGAFVTERGHAVSADGARVPYFLVHRRDVRPTGDVPVILYGYGGFNIPLGPSFSVAEAVFVERGGAYVLANLRGGGEFGRAWHDDGRLARKQHVFDDLRAVARELNAGGWTVPARTAINGASNGGLLVGASLTQHPEAFGAAIAEVGVLDMLRFGRFTIGWAWASDFGDPADPEQFRWLRAYSPLHNVVEGTAYPPTLLMTGDHDDRVVPAHSYKFAAALQHAQGGDAPILLRIETSAGHGVGKPTDKQMQETTDLLAFVEGVFGISPRRDAPVSSPSR